MNKLPVFAMFCLLIMFCTACDRTKTPLVVESTVFQNKLTGKWILQKRMYDPDTTFQDLSDTIEYVKILTSKSFVWYTYNKNNRGLIAMGGGSYKLEGESYTEFLEFNYPQGTGVEGSTIPFKCDVKDSIWYHAGFINERAYDQEIEQYVVVRERRLEEIWIRSEE